MILLDEYSAGQYRKSLTGYSYFMPNPIDDAWSWSDGELNILLEDAARKLGELNSAARLVPNIDSFIHLHVVQEAVISSRIEGTQTRMNEAVLDVSDVASERRDDWKEVNNYTTALKTAIDRLKELPLSSRLFRETHEILLASTRGQNRLPGAFRTSQNWIGGNSLTNATFIPPHHEHVPDLMSDLEKFIHHGELYIPDLIKIAIIHYQFETIHPFLDGNGRIGRLLIILYLVERKILAKPLLYLSSYFEQNRGLYYDNLTAVRTENKMLHWLKYFLRGISETASKSTRTLDEILDLKEGLEVTIRDYFGRRSPSARLLLKKLFLDPKVDVRQAGEITGLTYNAANSLIKEFVSSNILQEVTGYNRNRLFVFGEYIAKFKY